MEVILEINQKKDCPLGLAKLREVVRLTLKKSQLPIKNRQIVLSVAFVTSLKIRQINREFRKKDEITDVLSFGEYKSSRELLQEKKPVLFLGELIMCCSDIKKSAKINKLSFKDEFKYILSHGVLHLLGFNHEKKMFSVQEVVVQEVK